MSNKKYGVILADPPWKYLNSGTNGAAEKHYPTMSKEELSQLPVQKYCADNAVLLLWSTWPMLDEAMDLLCAWGFNYVTGFPWVKLNKDPIQNLFGDIELTPSFGTGFWVRGCSEPILIGRTGSPTLITPDKVPLGLLSKRMQHSRKPDSLHEYGELFEGPYLEMFARRPHHGWDAYGNEIKSSMRLE